MVSIMVTVLGIKENLSDAYLEDFHQALWLSELVLAPGQSAGF